MKRLFVADRKMNKSLAKYLAVSAAVLALATASTDSGLETSSELTANGHSANHKEQDVHSGNDSHDHDAGHAAGVHVVHLQYDYVDRPLILTLFLLAVVIIKLGQSLLLLFLVLFNRPVFREQIWEFLKLSFSFSRHLVNNKL